MSMEDSKKRLENSKTFVRHWTVECADLPRALETIAKHGAENVALRIVPGLNEEGYPDLHFLAIPHGHALKDCGAFEDCSTTCPPDC